jgi:hypothetical protein
METDSKIDWSLLPWGGISEVARLMTKMEGANGGKHERGAWRKQEIGYHLDHLYGHYEGYLTEEDGLDAESDMSHLAHLAARALFALELLMEKGKV